jgi:hypothetical protein
LPYTSPKRYLNGTHIVSAISSGASAYGWGIFAPVQVYNGDVTVLSSAYNGGIAWTSNTEATTPGSSFYNIKYYCPILPIYSNTIINYGSNPYYGVWLQLQFPFQFICKKFQLCGRIDTQVYTYLSNFIFTGSNNGTDFYQILNVTGYNATAYDSGTLTTNSTAYSYYRITINRFSGGSDNNPTVSYFWLYS